MRLTASMESSRLACTNFWQMAQGRVPKYCTKCRQCCTPRSSDDREGQYRKTRSKERENSQARAVQEQRDASNKPRHTRLHQEESRCSCRPQSSCSAHSTQVVYIVGKRQLCFLTSTHNIVKRMILRIWLLMSENARRKVASLKIPADRTG